MFRRSKEEWERQKWYLVRSLFEDLPLLSPIPETQEKTCVQPDGRHPSDVPVDRAYSPLPDLIIEKEPNRHDEPDEYYQYLEQKIRIIYNKMFFNVDTGSLDSFVIKSIDFDTRSQTEGDEAEHAELRDQEIDSSVQSSVKSDDNANIDSSHLPPNAKPDSETSVELPRFDEKKTVSECTEKSNSSELDESSSTTASENASFHTTMVTQVEVHQLEAYPEDTQDSTEPRLTFQTEEAEKPNNINVQAEINTGHGLNDISPIHSTEERKFEELAVIREAILEFAHRSHSTADGSSSNNDLETMRRQSLHSKSLHQSAIVTEERDISRLITEKECSAASIHLEMEVAEESSTEFSVILGITSTPKFIPAASDRSSKRNILTEISNFEKCSPKRRRYENLAVQTSFSISDDETDWERLKHNFFEGTPSIYRLCTCNNHNCSV